MCLCLPVFLLALLLSINTNVEQLSNQFRVSFRNFAKGGNWEETKQLGGNVKIVLHVYTCLRIVNLYGGAFTLKGATPPLNETLTIVCFRSTCMYDWQCEKMEMAVYIKLVYE